MTPDTAVHSKNKALISKLSAALYDFDPLETEQVALNLFDSECVIHQCHPFGDLTGPAQWLSEVLLPLHQALPDLERRDYIRIAGQAGDGTCWVGCAGFYMGVFAKPWLDIPPTGHLVAMRFHEFYRFESDRVVEMQAVWDIVDVMRQANSWPMTPSLGREWQVPGPATNDGVTESDYDPIRSDNARQLVIDMLDCMQKHPSEGGPEVMQLDKYWHPRMNWYGPSGIGTSRGIAGFRHWHQIPFLAAMPDRGIDSRGTRFHFFADNDYVAVTGWPTMKQTLTHDGWLGIPPMNQRVEIRSLDFWRIENGLIRENWVMVDLLDIYDQLGVDVFARLREFNKARAAGSINWPLPG